MAWRRPLKSIAKDSPKLPRLNFFRAKNNEQLEQFVSKEPRAVCLDSQGKMLTSVEFSAYLLKEIGMGGSRMAFVIGGAEGLPESLKKAHECISFSKMTPHSSNRPPDSFRANIPRLEIAKGTGYHK